MGMWYFWSKMSSYFWARVLFSQRFKEENEYSPRYYKPFDDHTSIIHMNYKHVSYHMITNLFRSNWSFPRSMCICRLSFAFVIGQRNFLCHFVYATINISHGVRSLLISDYFCYHLDLKNHGMQTRHWDVYTCSVAPFEFDFWWSLVYVAISLVPPHRSHVPWVTHYILGVLLLFGSIFQALDGFVIFGGV